MRLSSGIRARASALIGLSCACLPVLASPTYGFTADALITGAQAYTSYSSDGAGGLVGVVGNAKAWDASGYQTTLLPSGSTGGGAGMHYSLNAGTAAAVSGNYIVGYASSPNGTTAMVWQKSPSSFAPGYQWVYSEIQILKSPNSSYAMGVGGGQIVGQYGGQAHIWGLTGGAQTDLTPSNLSFASSAAQATNGNQQVGFGYTSGNVRHALLWNGSGSTTIDLTPTNLTGYTTSEAAAISTSGSTQVGFASGAATAGHRHAMLWQGSGNTAVDLQPTSTAFTDSQALATNGVFTVVEANNTSYEVDAPDDIYSYAAGVDDAMIWYGSTAFDLATLLPAGTTWTSSAAIAIGPEDTIYGWAVDNANNVYSVSWSASAIPEPSLCALLGVAVPLMARRRSR